MPRTAWVIVFPLIVPSTQPVPATTSMFTPEMQLIARLLATVNPTADRLTP